MQAVLKSHRFPHPAPAPLGWGTGPTFRDWLGGPEHLSERCCVQVLYRQAASQRGLSLHRFAAVFAEVPLSPGWVAGL